MPDRVPPEQMGRASGFKNMTDMAGMIISSLLVGRLLSPETRHPVGVVGLVAAVLAVTAALTLFGSREEPQTGQSRPLGLLLRTAWQEAFRIDLRLHAGYGWLIASRLLFLTGIYGIQSFAQYYVQDVLAVPNPIQVTGDLLASIVLALTGMALVGGWLGDRVGHRRTQWAASVLAFVGSVLMLWARTPGTLLAFGSVLGAGLGLFLTSNWALLNELAPPEQTGKFLGLTNLATAGAAALARLEGPMIDTLNQARPGAWWGYTALFLLGAVGIAASAVLLARVTEPRAALREVPSTPPGQPAP
jgi:MFS family permease